MSYLELGKRTNCVVDLSFWPYLGFFRYQIHKCDLRAVNISSSSAISLPDGVMICVVRICLS